MLFFHLHSHTQSHSNSKQSVTCPDLIPEGFLSPYEIKIKKDGDMLYREKMLDLNANLNGQKKIIGEIYTVPTVVHIVHSGQDVGTVQNPDVATVLSYIEEANRQFSHTHNGAKTYTNPNYGIDTEIEFCLSSTDPNGNYTSGVIRHYLPDYYSTDYWSLSRIASKLEWDTDQYLNIWINYTTNVLGISMGTRGVIMRNIAFNGIFFCHEVGHYLGLRHTFQGNSCSNNDCLIDGDGICDTPTKNASGLSGTCSNGQNLCLTDEDDPSINNPYRSTALGGLGEQPDMVENYMDYTQTCYDTYTLGQKNKMRFIYETYMTQMPGSPACNPQSQPNLDVSINYGIELDILCGEHQGSPTFVIENTGVATVNTLDIELYIDGILLRTDSWTGSLLGGEIDVLTLNPITFPDGQSDFEIRLVLPNGQQDDFALNNGRIKSVYVALGGIELDLTIVTDNFSQQSGYELRDVNGNVLLSEDIIPNVGTYETTICVDEGTCYTFVMLDTYGNGMCCSNGNGSYELKHQDGTILASGGVFTFEDATSFCINDPCDSFGGDNDNDGICANVDCNENDFYTGQLLAPGTACDDGDITTENDIIQSDGCSCAGTPRCPGYADTAFDTNPLTHLGSGSSSTSIIFNTPRTDIEFEITDIDDKQSGNPNSKYIDEVTVSYIDGGGITVVYGVFSLVPSEIITIPGPLTELIVSLADAYDGNAGTRISVNLSLVESCVSNLCLDSDSDGVCDDSDLCPGGDDTIDINNNGIPDFCENCPNVLTLTNTVFQGLYQANVEINSTAELAPNGQVEFKAGTCIVLNAGTNVPLSVTFEAYIEGCL